MSYANGHKGTLTSLAERMQIDNGDFEQVCAIAYRSCESSFSYSWAAAGLAGGSLDRGQMWADLVSEALIWLSEGMSVGEAMTIALKAWGKEQFKVAGVTNRRIGGKRVASVSAVPTLQIDNASVHDTSLEAATDRIAAEQILAAVADLLTDKEWELLLLYASCGTYAALADEIGLTPAGARRRVRLMQEKVAQSDISSL